MFGRLYKIIYRLYKSISIVSLVVLLRPILTYSATYLKVTCLPEHKTLDMKRGHWRYLLLWRLLEEDTDNVF